MQLANTVALIILALITWSTRTNIQKIETATNSMKDALVKATGEAQHAAGKEEGRVESARRAATLAQGVLEGQNERK